jgi:hypothetical protein
VARERLRDATEAFDLAARQEREIEAEYEAWKLLLEQMKAATLPKRATSGRRSDRQSRDNIVSCAFPPFTSHFGPCFDVRLLFLRRATISGNVTPRRP